MSDYQQSGPPAAGGPAHNGFFVEGVVVRDPHNGERFSALTVREGEKSYWDVMCWEDGPIAGFRDLKGGDYVRIEGKLGKRKDKKSGEWQISLSATGLRVAPRKYQEPPPPPQYQPPLAQQAAAAQQGWRPQPNDANAYPGFTQGTDGRGQHPDAADWSQQAKGLTNPPPWGSR